MLKLVGLECQLEREKLQLGIRDGGKGRKKKGGDACTG